jgi:hypothetical protein
MPYGMTYSGLDGEGGEVGERRGNIMYTNGYRI